MSNIQQIEFNFFKNGLLLILVVVFFSSCQIESPSGNTNPGIEITDSTIANNTLITKQLINVTTFDGSYDNVLDQASCIAIVLPVTVFINNQVTVEVTDPAGYSEVAIVIEEFDNDFSLEFSYPIQVKTTDHSIVTVNNLDELDNLRNPCLVENAIDNDIECVDFIYPLQLNFYNTNTQIANTVSIMNDENFYSFLNSLNENIVAEFLYPVEISLLNAGNLSINNNVQLLDTINDNSECDEDDDFSHFEINCTLDSLRENLLECTWKVTSNVGAADFNDITFQFEKSNVIITNDGEVDSNANWSLFNNGNLINLKLVSSFNGLSGSWSIISCSSNEVIIRNNDNIILVITRECT